MFPKQKEKRAVSEEAAHFLYSQSILYASKIILMLH